MKYKVTYQKLIYSYVEAPNLTLACHKAELSAVKNKNKVLSVTPSNNVEKN